MQSSITLYSLSSFLFRSLKETMRALLGLASTFFLLLRRLTVSNIHLSCYIVLRIIQIIYSFFRLCMTATKLIIIAWFAVMFVIVFGIFYSILNSVGLVLVCSSGLLLTLLWTNITIRKIVFVLESLSSMMQSVISSLTISIIVFWRTLILNGNNGEYTNGDDVVEFFILDGQHYYIVDNKVVTFCDDPNLINLMVEIVELGQFYSFSYEFPQRRIRFIRSIYLQMIGKLGVLPDEPRNYTLLCNFMMERFSVLPATFITDMIYAFSYKNRLKAAPSNLRGSRLAISGIINCGSIQRIETTYSITPANYFYNGRWKILKSNGFTLAVADDQSLRQAVAFHTAMPPKQGNKNKNFFFHFSPREPFQTYGPCSENLCAAMSRLFKARPEEELLFTNQLRLLNGIPQFIIMQAADACGADYNSTNNSITFRPTFINSRRKNERITYMVRPDPVGFMGIDVEFIRGFSLFFLFLQFFDYVTTWFSPQVLPLLEIVYNLTSRWIDRETYLLFVVSIPHAKQFIYKSYMDSIKKAAMVIENQGEWEAKFKWEFGKVGKVGRLYATGEHLAIVDKVECDYMKYLNSVPIQLGVSNKSALFRLLYRNFPHLMEATNFIHHSAPSFKFIVKFCDAQKKESCDELYREAKNIPYNSGIFFYFSDDSFLVLNIMGQILLFEIDISMCDSSNSFAIFTRIYYQACLLGFGSQMYMLLQQAARPVKIVNPSHPSEYLTMRPQSFFEYSGIRCTGVLNNDANKCIGIAIGHALEKYFSSLLPLNLHAPVELGQYVIFGWLTGLILDNQRRMQAGLPNERNLMPDIKEIIVNAAKEVGFVVTVQEAPSFNSVTFLKRAFNGTTSWLVYGAIFRSLGVIDGLFTHDSLGVSRSEFMSMNSQQHFEKLLYNSVSGLALEPGSPIMDALRTRAGLSTKHQYHLTMQDLLDRYGGSRYEVEELIDAIYNLQPYDLICCDFLERIFHRDYGTTLQLRPELHDDAIFTSFADTF